MANKKDEVLNLNVGGKKFSIRRGVMCVDPKSKLASWFNVGGRSEQIALGWVYLGIHVVDVKSTSTQDKSGNYFIDRDGRLFRYIIMFLRAKGDKHVHPSFILPMKPDALANLAGEARALNINELYDMCMDMLARYKREESGYVVAYTNTTLQKNDAFQAEKGDGTTKAGAKGAAAALDFAGW